MADKKYVSGETESGFVFNIEIEKLDNMELIDALAELDDDPLKISLVITLLFGQEEKKRLYDHVRTEDGIVPGKVIEKELSEIFRVSQELKN
ncbi:hypothetical protein [Mogibacterium timidum]|uniref:hypothetical protein n=1 Tax=Mogibacterium timidum TaxID=35519 RepID=UPI00248CED37|nr:hypothetical protein [Mogibacterium timidum]